MNPKIRNTAGSEASLPRTFRKAGVVARRLGIHPKTLARWADRGHIHRHKLNSRVVLFDETEIERLMTSSRI